MSIKNRGKGFHNNSLQKGKQFPKTGSTNNSFLTIIGGIIIFGGIGILIYRKRK
ncbi:LPXTG cell wall anchor domain-containing protein [Enterococcus sp. HMSC064A12]|uniref:LPXTG cell wall anchor domain-containing protein n=1 Tax=Enterococcus sp. HMSC064A12 TaxID=1715019 RepID=UPI003523BFE2